MALGKKNKVKDSEKSSGKKGDAVYVNIAQVLEGEKGDPYIKASNYKGRLIWQQFGGDEGDDESDSKFYEIKSAYINKPHPKAPEFVLQQLTININNSKQVSELES